jgi:hypothetical protein
MSIEARLSLILLFGVLGIVFIVGTKFKWKFLVDPSVSVWFSSSAFIRKYMGKKALIALNYFLGFVSILVSVILFIMLFIAA